MRDKNPKACHKGFSLVDDGDNPQSFTKPHSFSFSTTAGVPNPVRVPALATAGLLL